MANDILNTYSVIIVVVIDCFHDKEKGITLIFMGTLNSIRILDDFEFRCFYSSAIFLTEYIAAVLYSACARLKLRLLKPFMKGFL